MKKIFLTSLSVTLTYLFLCTNFLCQTVNAASEQNEVITEPAAPEEQVIPDNNQAEPNETNIQTTSESSRSWSDINDIGIFASPTEEKKSLRKEKASNYNLLLKRHSIEIGPEIYSFTYKEPGVKDEGVFYGGAVNYTYRWWVPPSPNEPLLPGSTSFRAEFRYATGDADYDGELQPSGTPYRINDIEYDTYETRLMLGIDELNINWLASLSTGVGYRYSTDDSSIDPLGYKRESNYIYIPVAYQLDGKFENNWAWGTKLEVDILVWGEQKSYLSDLGLGDPDIKNHQKEGYGLRGSIRLQNKIRNSVLIVEPFIRYWNIEQSESEYIPPYEYFEPKNNTTEYGVQLLWKF